MSAFQLGVLVGFAGGGLVMFVTCLAWALWAMSPSREMEDEHEHAHGV